MHFHAKYAFCMNVRALYMRHSRPSQGAACGPAELSLRGSSVVDDAEAGIGRYLEGNFLVIKKLGVVFGYTITTQGSASCSHNLNVRHGHVYFIPRACTADCCALFLLSCTCTTLRAVSGHLLLILDTTSRYFFRSTAIWSRHKLSGESCRSVQRAF